MGIRFFGAAISLYRSFSSRSSSSSSSSSSSRTKFGKPRVKWSGEQKAILAHATNGSSMFITGSAGTGKTVLLQRIIHILRKLHGRPRVFVTASTGVAACLLGGQTLHSFSGIGFFDGGDRDALLRRVVMNKGACTRWEEAKALVIDEISMIDANVFENLEFIARKIRGSDEVWGGLKLVVCGDFFQLPPVPNRQRISKEKFAFEADCWDDSFDIQVELSQVFRQSDARLIKLLQGVRKGETDAEDLQILEQCCSTDKPLLPFAVRLYPRIDDVKRTNKERLESLGEKVLVYDATDWEKGLSDNASDDGGKLEDDCRKQLKQGMAPDQLTLCRGARVMLIRNLNTRLGLCNGTTGTVTGFTKVKGISVADLCPDNLLPVVEFDSGRTMVIVPQEFGIAEGGDVVAWRRQLPLILAWALSIHKCQGMTLDRVHTDLSRAFGSGMVYVALSRVRSLEGLALSGFCPKKIKAHPKCIEFYKRFKEEDGTISKLLHSKKSSVS